MHQDIDIDLDLGTIIEKLPLDICEALASRSDTGELLEVVLDLGREPQARFLNENVVLLNREIIQNDLQHVIQRIGAFGVDNRAGIERTLHRISAIRNRSNSVVGLTVRVGRAVYGTIKIIEDIVLTGKSIVLLGRPGVGKTTMLREIARVLADSADKRVVVVDTSNEIAGDGDIPHPGIGRARRMQVGSPAQQHSVMIEAVENHMPEVIIIDEIGTEMDANACRTIAERGVQLVATAHGNALENLVLNPTLSDLVGGVESVTLGDIEASRRRTQKTVLERRSPPTFDILVEIQGWNEVSIHADVAQVVDLMLRGHTTTPEIRILDGEGNIRRSRVQRRAMVNGKARNDIGRFELQRTKGHQTIEASELPPVYEQKSEHEKSTIPETVFKPIRIHPYGVNRGKLQQAVKGATLPIEIVDKLPAADVVLTTKVFYRRKTKALKQAEEQGSPVYVLRKNTTAQIQQFLKAITRNQKQILSEPNVEKAIREVQEAMGKIGNGEHKIQLNPQTAYVRHIQHQVAEYNGLSSSSSGREPGRYVTVYRK